MDMMNMLLGPLLADPRLKAVIDEIPHYAEQWARLNHSIRFLEASAASVDNRLVYLIAELDKANERLLLLLTETNLTPDLHAGALAMAAADPRNHPAAAP